MLGMNNCTVSGGVFNQADSKKSEAGHLYLGGKTIVSNSTLLGDGVVSVLQYNHTTDYSNVDGSLLINSVVCNENSIVDGGTYDPIRLLKTWNAITIKGWYNIYQGLCGETSSTSGDTTMSHFKANDDNEINKAWENFGFAETNYGTTDNPNYLFDYSIPAGSTVTKVPTVEEVATAIKSMSVARKTGGETFGNMFYNWLTSIGAADKDARGNVRTTNRQGALVK